MHMTLDKMYYGNYKFIVELDTGSETGGNQLTIWVAEKVGIDAVPLSQFGTRQLLNALIEPQRSRLCTQLEEEKLTCQKPFEEEMAHLQQPFQVMGEKQGEQLPRKVKRKVRNLREQMKIAVQRLEAEFARRELRPLERHRFDRDALQAESRVFGEEFSLRDFYFEEANEGYICNFCQKFASDAAYRQEVLTREVRWAKRNALFVRNLPAVFCEDSSLSHIRDYRREAHDFFHWVDTYIEEILALPEYQYLKGIDSAFQPSATELDPFIRPAVDLLNQIPGATTQFSCQGVTGKIQFQGRDLLVVSPHAEYAYVSFSALKQSLRDAIVELLPEFPSIKLSYGPVHSAQPLQLRSTGDNLRFREELVTLARRILSSPNICYRISISHQE